MIRGIDAPDAAADIVGGGKNEALVDRLIAGSIAPGSALGFNGSTYRLRVGLRSDARLVGVSGTLNAAELSVPLPE